MLENNLRFTEWASVCGGAKIMTVSFEAEWIGINDMRIDPPSSHQFDGGGLLFVVQVNIS